MTKHNYPRFILCFLCLLQGAVALEINAAEPNAFYSWGRQARVAGSLLNTGMNDEQLDVILDNLAAQQVSVIEADSQLSNYLTEREFTDELALMRRFTDKAHQHRNRFKVVWYYPGLEVLTSNVDDTKRTMARDHPDWLQRGPDGTPNAFIGGEGQIFWVEAGMESAWMSPSSPYRDYFYARVERIAKETKVDGLWIDVPLYADFGPVKWSDVSSYAAEQFRKSYPGSLIPAANTSWMGNWDDPDWRRWIVWRHQELTRFLADATKIARKDNPEFTVFVETLPTDYAMTTVYGLEGADLRPLEGVTHVWEVDTLSNTSAMRKAREDDWISYISMQKYIKAASGNKPAWSFAYGKLPGDAELVMAEILAAGNNPYELQVPQMTTTVGAEYRRIVFSWIKANQALLWQPSAAKVGLLYSPASRDFVDQASGEGMYATTDAEGDPLWWSNETIHSAYQRQYVAEYRGMVKLLVHQHIPFDALVKPQSLAELQRYEVILLPDLQALSDIEAQLLKDYISAGGNILITGPNPSGMDQFGISRQELALSEVLGFKRSGFRPGQKVQTYGRGRAYSFSGLPGKAYFANAVTAATSANDLMNVLKQASTAVFTSSADRRIHIELTEKTKQSQTIVQLVNFMAMDGSGTVKPVTTTAPISLTIPTGKRVRAVTLSTLAEGDAKHTPLAYQLQENKLNVNVPLTNYALVVVHWENTATTNKQPIAEPDQLVTLKDQSLTFTAQDLLANDSDADGNVLNITALDNRTKQGGSINQTYVYTPPVGFTGSDAFTYSVSDGKGGVATTTVSIAVDQPRSVPTRYFPAAIELFQGSYGWGDLSSLASFDYTTLGINSAFQGNSSAPGGATDWYAVIKPAPDLALSKRWNLIYTGYYSKSQVYQNLAIYNFAEARWQLLDTRLVNSQQTIRQPLSDAAPKYLSKQGEVWVRVSGFKAGKLAYTDFRNPTRVNRLGVLAPGAWQFDCWADYLTLELN